MNLQPVVQKKVNDDDHRAWRNSHVIRFSQIDGAGIVYYPRYLEMLADSFPQQFAMTHPAQIDINFHHPVRLGERLLLEHAPAPAPQSASGLKSELKSEPEPEPEPELESESEPGVPQHATALVESEPAEAGGDLKIIGRSADELCFKLHKIRMHPAITAHWSTDDGAFVRQVRIGAWMTGADGRMHLSRCYELTAVLMEEWFTESLQCPFATTQSSGGVLVPTVKLQTEVQELPSQGDIVEVALVVLHIGRSSLGLGMTVSRKGQLLVRTRQTIVFVTYQNEQLSSVQIPADLLPALNRQLIVAAQ